MSKIKKTKFQKSDHFVRSYPDEFIHGPNGVVYCMLCSCNLDPSRKSVIESHRISNKHSTSLCYFKKDKIVHKKQEFFSDTNTIISNMLIEAFVCADIPLEKLRNEKIKDLFSHLKVNIPSVSTARRTVKFLAEKHFQNLKEYFFDKLVYIMVDETEIKGKKYFNILCGLVCEPKDIKLLDCIQVNGNINSVKAEKFIRDSLEKYNINDSNFILFLSDAAPYMILVGKNLRID